MKNLAQALQSWQHKAFIIHEFDELESTNSFAFSMAQARRIFDHEVIVANSQKNGRGRQSRQWYSPKGNLYFSLVLQNKNIANFVAEKIPQLSFVGILALRLAIEKIFFEQRVKAEIHNKWPNDLLIEKKKVAGILLESQVVENKCEFVVLGVGVNIDSCPENSEFLATKLANFDCLVSPSDLLKRFLDEFEDVYRNWQNFGFVNIRNLWLKRAYNLSEQISLKLDDHDLKGVFSDIDLQGNLILKNETGFKKMMFGDVFPI